MPRTPEPMVPRRIAIWVYVGVPVAATALLIIHTVGLAGTTVDTTTLGLLVLLLLVPLAPHITRLSAGGVEAEIGRKDAKRLQEAASELPPASPANAATSTAAASISELIERDPPLGLAKLRIELENELRRLLNAHDPENKGRSSLGVMARQLTELGVLPPEITDPLADVATLANRAIHGEYVPADVAADIGAVGLRVLSALHEIRSPTA